MPALALSSLQRREHRAAAHHLDPVVHVGSAGLTAAVVEEVNTALNAHGLIKVRVHDDDRAAREAMLADLADKLGAAAVNHIGKLLVLWRPVPERAAKASAATGAAPRSVKLVKPAKSGTHRPTVRRVKVLGNQRVTAGGKIKRAKPRRASVKKGA
jgi:putative YhbY family RNA-binding protein